MDDVWLDALGQMLQGGEWQTQLQVFTAAHCAQFATCLGGTQRADGTGYELAHHDVWRQYKEMVEDVLEGVLQQLGGSIEALEKAIDEKACAPATGPRDRPTAGPAAHLRPVQS